MPRYFFHLRLNDHRQTDEKGTDLADDDAAREEAMRTALGHINERVKDGWVQNGRDVLEGSLEVAKEGGAVVLTLPLAEVPYMSAMVPLHKRHLDPTEKS